jgi:adenine-specific DNA methylase
MIDAPTGSGHDRRFIEETFPVKEVSAISAKEKYIRHGHISTLHIWWARRPLAASRATAYAALIPPPDDITEWQRQRDFIVELSKWENSLNQPLLDKARGDILLAHAERLSKERGEPVTVEDIEAGRAPRPRVLDPFAGGGAIPLEALRLGCETYASDYNPVATLILKATLEYPQKYGQPAEREETSDLFGGLVTEKRTVNPLLEAVKKWGDWVLKEAREELARFYASDTDGSVPVGYIWARTIPCQNPGCGADIPLMRQLWLAKKPKKKVALYPEVEGGQVTFRIVGDGYDLWPQGFDPKAGTVARAVATCPVCGAVVAAQTTRSLFQQGKAGQKMVAVVLTRPHRQGKHYRVATETDEAAHREAEAALQGSRERLMLEWGMDPVPDESLPPVGTLGFRIQRYGMKRWGSLFNARQLLALITFTDKVRQAHEQMIAEEMESEFAKAVVTYLALLISRCADFGSTIARWFNHVENASNSFARPAVPMTWDYFELNLLSPVSQGTFKSMYRQITRTLQAVVDTFSAPAVVSNGSVNSLPYPDGHFDTVLTDPPYYDNVPYSYLSDFFYVWLKRTVGHLYPQLFSTPLTPKASEIVAYSHGEGGSEGGRTFFEETLKQAFQEIHRVLKPDGVAVIVYAHKSTAGWETVVNALLNSGLVVSGSWPLQTEMKGRLRARDSAALASSIYIIARKTARLATGFHNEVQEELRRHLERKLQRLWEEGIGGADFFIAAIGSGIEVFGKYEQVMDYEGNAVRAGRLLQDVRTIATEYAVRQILQDGFAGEVSDLTRLYVLWRWNYGDARVPFDEARKLAQSCGVDLAQEWGRRGFVRKERQFVRLAGPQKRKLDDLKEPSQLIDVLHRVLLLWEKGRREEMVEALASSGYGQSEVFYRVAQAVSETLPNESEEKKLLDGFLVGRERVRDEVGKATRQARLFE